MELTLDLMFTKNQADLRCLAHQNKLDNGQRHRVSHPVFMALFSVEHFNKASIDHYLRLTANTL